MNARTRRKGRPYRRARAEMFTIYGHVCIHCGHPGAYEADHVIPLDEWPDQPHDPHLLRPSHGSNCPCPICGRHCNQVRGTKAIDGQPYRPAIDW